MHYNLKQESWCTSSPLHFTPNDVPSSIRVDDSVTCCAFWAAATQHSLRLGTYTATYSPSSSLLEEVKLSNESKPLKTVVCCLLAVPALFPFKDLASPLATEAAASPSNPRSRVAAIASLISCMTMHLDNVAVSDAWPRPTRACEKEHAPWPASYGNGLQCTTQGGCSGLRQSTQLLQ
jgi:hypothetical protein